MGDSGFHSHGFVIIDAVPPGELQTGKALYEMLCDTISSNGEELFVRRVPCQSASEVLNALRDERKFVENEGKIPIIHIEGHGDKEHLRPANGFYLRWKSVFEELKIVNILTCNNLFFSSAACESAYWYKGASITSECPVYGMLAPATKITAGEVAVGFQAFYRTLLESGDLHTSLNSLANATDAKKFAYIFSHSLFENVACKYLLQHCMGKGLAKRKEELLTVVVKEISIGLKKARKSIKKELSKSQAIHLRRFHRKFLMLDRCKSNETRFPFNAAKFERQVKNGIIKCLTRP